MQTGTGASLVGASLAIITGDQFVQYNQRHSMRWGIGRPDRRAHGGLAALSDLELNVAHDDTARIDALRTIARKSTAAHNTPIFRTLHILEQRKAMPQ